MDIEPKTNKARDIGYLRHIRKKKVCKLLDENKNITRHEALKLINAQMVKMYPILKSCIDFQPDKWAEINLIQNFSKSKRQIRKEQRKQVQFERGLKKQGFILLTREEAMVLNEKLKRLEKLELDLINRK